MKGYSPGVDLCQFVVEFLLEHLLEIARALFIRKIQPAVNAIDAHIENLNKKVMNLEARHECLLSSVTSPRCFKDQTVILSL